MTNGNFERIQRDFPKIAELYLHSGAFQESINCTWKYENNESQKMSFHILPDYPVGAMLNLDSFLESKIITEDNADLLFEEWSTCHIGRTK